MTHSSRYLLVLALWLTSVAVAADDLVDSERFLCSVLEVNSCGGLGQGCGEVSIQELNIPRFIEFDLEAKSVSATAASHENRTSSIASVRRDDGLIVLQSYENGRAVSWIIVEETGSLTAVVATEERGVVGFAECTPLDSGGRANR